ncbi:permease family protein [Pelomyxa schiedti]|nr:permease family protein [Pelomyxa schiedti]
MLLNETVEVQGAVPRWVAFAKASLPYGTNRTYKINPSMVLVINSTAEDEIGLGREWDHRPLNKTETHVSGSILRQLGILPNANQSIHLSVDLFDYLDTAGVLEGMTKEEFVLQQLESVMAFPVEGELARAYIDIPLTPDENGIFTLNSTQMEAVYNQFSEIIVNLTGVSLPPFNSTSVALNTTVSVDIASAIENGFANLNSTYTTVEATTFANGTIMVIVSYDFSPALDSLVNGIIELAVIQENYTVIDAIESPRGKWPTALGGVIVLEQAGVEALVNDLLNETVIFLADQLMVLNEALYNVTAENIFEIPARNVTFMLGNTSITVLIPTIPIDWNQVNVTMANFTNVTINEIELQINDTITTLLNSSVAISLNEYAFMVVVLYSRRMEMYMQGADGMKSEMIGFTNSISNDIGVGYPATFTSPVAAAIAGYSFLRLFLDQIFNFVTVVLVFLGAVLIYSLLLSDVESKTYEYGMLRALGMMQWVLVELLGMQSLGFSIPGILFAAFLASFAVMPIDLSFSTQAILLASLLGLLLPIFANIFPIKRALSRTLRDALDIYHMVQSEITVKIVKLEEVGLQPWLFFLSLIIVCFGFVTYYLIPYAFTFSNYTMFFTILVGILLGFLFGMSMISQVIQPWLERLLVLLLVWGTKKGAMMHLVNKNLAGHSRRNIKTAVMVTTALAFIIFAGSVFTLQARSIGEFIALIFGADVLVQTSSYSNPLPEENLTIYLNQQMTLDNGIVKDFTFVTFPLSYHPMVRYTDISNLAGFPSYRQYLYGVERNFFNAAYDYYYLPTELSSQFKYEKTSQGKGDAVKSLYDNAHNQTMPFEVEGIEVPPDIYATDLGQRRTSWLPPTEEVYKDYFDVIISEALRDASSVDTQTPLHLKMGYYTASYYRLSFRYLAKARALTAMMPTFLYSKYRAFAWYQPILVSMDQYQRLLEDVARGSSTVAPERPPMEKLLIATKSGTTSTQVEGLANDLSNFLVDDYTTVTDTQKTVRTTTTALSMLNLFFITVAAIAMFLCFFILWLSFTANVEENSWEFAVLRSIGLEANQVILLYVYEALCLVLGCSILGSIIGILVAVVLTLQFNLFTQLPFKFAFPYALFFASFGMAIVISLLGSFLPATVIRHKKIGSVLKGK